MSVGIQILQMRNVRYLKYQTKVLGVEKMNFSFQASLDAFLLEDSAFEFFNHCAYDGSFKKWSARLPFKRYNLCIDIFLL